MVDIAYRNCDRLVALVNDILDIEKIEAGKMEFQMETLDLADAVAQALEANKSYAEQYDVELRLHPSATQLQIIGDAQRLQQVLANLISNAARFSPTGREVDIALTSEGNIARLSVTDHGAGIPEEFRDRIFQKFAQADPTDSGRKGGSGLGLSITKAIVEGHGGRIGFESEEGVGTTFNVYLPSLADAQPPLKVTVDP